MVATSRRTGRPLSLVVTGEAESWLPAIEQIVGPQWILPCRVSDDDELLDLVETGLADAAVLDDAIGWKIDVLQLLRMIRRLNAVLPVVIITDRQDRRWLESALRLAVFSVVSRPLGLEDLLRQIQRMMLRLDSMLREQPDW